MPNLREASESYTTLADGGPLEVCQECGPIAGGLLETSARRKAPAALPVGGPGEGERRATAAWSLERWDRFAELTPDERAAELTAMRASWKQDRSPDDQRDADTMSALAEQLRKRSAGAQPPVRSVGQQYGRGWVDPVRGRFLLGGGFRAMDTVLYFKERIKSGDILYQPFESEGTMSRAWAWSAVAVLVVCIAGCEQGDITPDWWRSGDTFAIKSDGKVQTVPRLAARIVCLTAVLIGLLAGVRTAKQESKSIDDAIVSALLVGVVAFGILALFAAPVAAGVWATVANIVAFILFIVVGNDTVYLAEATFQGFTMLAIADVVLCFMLSTDLVKLVRKDGLPRTKLRLGWFVACLDMCGMAFTIRDIYSLIAGFFRR